MTPTKAVLRKYIASWRGRPYVERDNRHETTHLPDLCKVLLSASAIASVNRHANCRVPRESNDITLCVFILFLFPWRTNPRGPRHCRVYFTPPLLSPNFVPRPLLPCAYRSFSLSFVSGIGGGSVTRRSLVARAYMRQGRPQSSCRRRARRPPRGQSAPRCPRVPCRAQRCSAACLIGSQIDGASSTRYPTVYLSICPSIYLSIYLSICPSIYLSIYLEYLSVYLPIYPSIAARLASSCPSA